MEQPLPNITNRSAAAKQGCKKTNFWALFQQLWNITENYTNGDILHQKRIQIAQTYNTFKHRISNYQISLLYIVAAIITFIKNTPFSSLFLLKQE